MTEPPAPLEVVVTPAQVRRIDRADGLVDIAPGVRLEPTQVHQRTRTGDRTPRGFLRQVAAERIAADLTEVAVELLARRHAREAAT